MKGSTRFRILLLATSLFFLMGCDLSYVPSLAPLYDEEHGIFDNTLSGTWTAESCAWSARSSDNGCLLVIEPMPDAVGRDRGSSPRGYVLTVTDERGRSTKLEGMLVQLGKNRFLDTTIQLESLEMSMVYAVHFRPLHVFWKIAASGGTLSLTGLNEEWLKESIYKKRVKIEYEVIGDTVALSAPTAALQEFFARHANDNGAFPPKPGDSGFLVWHRK